MNVQEAEVREAIGILSTISAKLNLVRNELIPYYGKQVTLEDVEAALWQQHEKYDNIVHSHFQD